MLHLRFIGAALCALLMLLTQATVAFAGTSTTQAKPAAANPAPTVLIKTSAGEIVVELDPAKAPKTVDNFLQYVKAGFYNGTVFHRVIRGFMIQGGGYTPQGSEKSTRGPIEIESSNGLKNRRYAIAMARTADPNSATAQFFINTKDNRFLDYPGQDGFGYAVFGKVIKGSEVVDQIEAVDTDRSDKPIKPVIIESATLID
jgi:peptidyl-prolyl cis-trans isomerase A (cyclophilin A)/peptidyl-prolyl cis-trans isomerase B (cyclophilin B)